MSPSGIRFSLRYKLLLVSLAVLIIPYLGFDYLRQMESYLRDTLESTLVDTAYAIAGGLNNNYRLFNIYTNEQENSLYIHGLQRQVQLDGYTDDWLSYLDWSDIYQATNGDGSFRLIASSDDKYYYVFIQANDSSPLYATPAGSTKINGDHLILVFTDRNRTLQHYYFVPTGPGLIRPFRYEQRFDEYGVETQVQRDITNISAVWQRTATGYNIEMKIPAYVIGEYMGFILKDFDGNSLNPIASAGEDTFLSPNRLLRSSKLIENIILTQGSSEGRRTWVLDQFGQVLASDGSLKRAFPDNAFNIIYTLLLPPAYDQFTDDLAGASRLKGSEVVTALSGQTETRWRSSPDGKAVIVSAATPVWLDNKVAGAVVVEETTNNIQIMQRQVLANLFNKTLLIFVVVVLLLILFAGRLSSRLIRLNRETANAIDAYGRVKDGFTATKTGDEIGELSRSFSDMLGRLQQYHHYLENMAGSLSHELRTPMAIVQTSLDRLKQEQDEAAREEALSSAAAGLQRLQTLLTRLSEAASLEQALQEAHKERIELSPFLEKCVDGYRLAYPTRSFELELPGEYIEYDINHDLFYQMLDKLVSNAVDFSDEGKPIRIKLLQENDALRIEVSNYGPKLPEGMTQELFNSMVSIRRHGKKAGPHLGLGLFIARLIADFHQARLTARNLDDGVCIAIEMDQH